LWYFNGVPEDTVFAGGQVWFPLESGWYRVESVSADLGCPVASDSVLVCWPLEAPVVTQDAAGDLVVSEDFAEYQWWADGLPMEGEVSATLPAPGPGMYTVWVTDFADCPAVESASVTYVGVGNIGAEAELRLYPNPFVGGFRMEVGAEWVGGSVEIVDVNGTVRVRQLVQSSAMEWDGDLWPAGPFVLRVVSADGQDQLTRTLIKH